MVDHNFHNLLVGVLELEPGNRFELFEESSNQLDVDCAKRFKVDQALESEQEVEI